MKILVAGEVFLDEYIYGNSSRLSPEAPVPVIKHEKSFLHLGGAGNVAKNLASLGCDVSLLTFIGKDKYSNDLKNIISNFRINILETESDDIKTLKKIRFIASQQQLLRYDIEKEFNDEQAKYISRYMYRICKEYDIVIISDYDKGFFKYTSTEKIRSINPKAITLVDTKSCSSNLIRCASILKPNANEINKICQKYNIDTKDIKGQSEEIMSKFNVDNLIATLGDKGINLFIKGLDQNIENFYFPSRKLEIFDVTGAGDTVISIIASEISNGKSVIQASYSANYVAGKAVSFLGTYTPTKDDLINSQQKIIFTNGCFDILHVGHIELLNMCNQLGHKVIVGLNSDASVRKIKGKARPYNKEQDRKILLENLKSVSEVIIFEEDTPYNLIKKLKPNILVKGGNYCADEVIGKDIVEAYGGEVIIFPTLGKYSTTAIAQNINDKIKR